jgi:hypothetical protein
VVGKTLKAKTGLYPPNRQPSDFPPHARETFRAFVQMANVRMLHPLDWGRFYEFVATCHQTRAEVSERDVKVALQALHFSDAATLAGVYAHGREMFKVAPGVRARRQWNSALATRRAEARPSKPHRDE